MQGLEDKTKIVVVNVEDSGDQTRGANLASDINQLKEKLKNMENELREIKKQQNQIVIVEKDDGSIDYTAIINQVKDSLEREIQDINDRLDGMNGESDLAD